MERAVGEEAAVFVIAGGQGSVVISDNSSCAVAQTRISASFHGNGYFPSSIASCKMRANVSLLGGYKKVL